MSQEKRHLGSLPLSRVHGFREACLKLETHVLKHMNKYSIHQSSCAESKHVDEIHGLKCVNASKAMEHRFGHLVLDHGSQNHFFLPTQNFLKEITKKKC